MLGKVVTDYFACHARVVTTPLRYPDPAYMTWLNTASPDVVVNCAVDKAGDPTVNTALPRQLHRAGYYTIHPSTDAIGESTPYGDSKRLAEPYGSLVIRTSIVDVTGGLLRWLSQQRSVTGFTDHWWNGITTLAWAEQAWNHIGQRGIIEPVSPDVTKAELLRIAADVFGWPVVITERPSGNPVDRRLRGTSLLPPIRDQLLGLRAWR